MSFYTAVYTDDLAKGSAQIYFNLPSLSPDFAYFIEQIPHESEPEEALLSAVRADYPDARIALAGRALVITIPPKAEETDPTPELIPESEPTVSVQTQDNVLVQTEQVEIPDIIEHAESPVTQEVQETTEATNSKRVYFITDQNQVLSGQILRKKIDAQKVLHYLLLGHDQQEYTRAKTEVFSTREEAEPNANSFFHYRYTFLLNENFLNEWNEKQDKYLGQAHTYSDLIKCRAKLGRRYLHTQLEVVVMEAPKDAHTAQLIERVPFLKFKEQYRYKYFE